LKEHFKGMAAFSDEVPIPARNYISGTISVVRSLTDRALRQSA